MPNKQSPYVSVIMTSYNRCHYIGQAIDSIISQECNFAFEIIIGDDYSTDDSRQLLLKYKDLYPNIIRLNLHDKNVGFGPNWASTCKLAVGKYLAFCDDDDYWCDNKHLQLLSNYLDEHNNCGLVYANRWILDVTTNTKKLANAYIPENVNQFDYLYNKGFPILFSASMIRKSIMDKYVDLNAFIQLKFPIQDFPTAILLAPHCDFHYFEKATVVYRSYSGSMSKPKDYDNVIRKYTQEKVMNKYLCEQLNLPYDELGDDYYRYNILLRVAYNNNDYKKAHEFAKFSSNSNKKKWFALTYFTFKLFRFAKNIKDKFLN